MGRPATGTAPHRTIRVDDELWHAAKAVAQAAGQDLSKVIRQALVDYVAQAEAVELPKK